MENKLSIEEILKLSEILPLPLQSLFLKGLKLAAERFKKGEENV